MSATVLQAWVAAIGTVLAAALGLIPYFHYRTRRDRMAAVGAAFSATVEALASDNEIKRMAAAVLLRRFFDRGTEQGEADTPYRKETIEVIAGVLRETEPGQFQKVLADGLRYAHHLSGADLQRCNLYNAYLGRRATDEEPLDLSGADLFEAKCEQASFREVVARGTTFYKAILTKAVFIDAELEGADFRAANLSGAKFFGARIGGAKFEDAEGLPQEVADALRGESVAASGTIVSKGAAER